MTLAIFDPGRSTASLEYIPRKRDLVTIISRNHSNYVSNLRYISLLHDESPETCSIERAVEQQFYVIKKPQKYCDIK
ncbi:hypothetical protein TSAR_016662 [Trichomalopsis sarcophagae]|uniref:Uncharacterized protein n=1 Tax=Trichomalopsis sarcophagae TaxID=543379 RepID=A0A232FCX5_9HYME|nr:hypothetical protein TSAR_016662 [Trichomalopsis sarcophagae]